LSAPAPLRAWIFDSTVNCPAQLRLDVFDQQLLKIPTSVVFGDPHLSLAASARLPHDPAAVLDGGSRSIPASRSNAAATVSSSGSANGSAVLPRNESRRSRSPAAACAMTTIAVRHHRLVWLICAIPFQHGEFRQMQVARSRREHPRQFEYFSLTRRQQFLGREFREVRVRVTAAPALSLSSVRARAEWFRCPAISQDSGFDLDKTLLVEPRPNCLRNRHFPRTKNGRRSTCRARPPWRWGVNRCHQPTENLP